MPWVSQYLVMKRVSIEPNFHSLYSNFLDTLKNPEFNKMVLNETYRNIKVLLTSDKAAANFSDRSLLKNLGHWLGMITLAKNKPILHTVSFKMDICFKLGWKKCFRCHWDFSEPLTMYEFLILCPWSLRLF